MNEFNVRVEIQLSYTGQVYRISDNLNTEPVLVSTNGIIEYGNYTRPLRPIITIEDTLYPACRKVFVAQYQSVPVIMPSQFCYNANPEIMDRVLCKNANANILVTQQCRDAMPTIMADVLCKVFAAPTIIATQQCYDAQPMIEANVLCRPNANPVIMAMQLCRVSMPVIADTVMCRDAMAEIAANVICKDAMPDITANQLCRVAMPMIQATQMCRDANPSISPAVDCREANPTIMPTVQCNATNIQDINNVAVSSNSASPNVFISQVRNSSNPIGVGQMRKTDVGNGAAQAFDTTNFGVPVVASAQWWDVKIFNVGGTDRGYASYSTDSGGDNYLVEFNPVTMQPLRVVNHSSTVNRIKELAYDPVLNRVYYGSSRIGYFDVNTGNLINNYIIATAGFASGESIDYIPNLDILLVGTENADDNILVIQNVSNAANAIQTLFTIPNLVAGATSVLRGIDYSPAYGKVFVSAQNLQRVVQFNLQNALLNQNNGSSIVVNESAILSGLVVDDANNILYYGRNNNSPFIQQVNLVPIVAKAGSERTAINVGTGVTDVASRSFNGASPNQIYYSTAGLSWQLRTAEHAYTGLNTSTLTTVNTFQDPVLNPGAISRLDTIPYTTTSGNTLDVVTGNNTGQDSILRNVAGGNINNANNGTSISGGLIDKVNNRYFAFANANAANGIRSHANLTLGSTGTNRPNIGNGRAGAVLRQHYIFGGTRTSSAINVIQSTSIAIAPVNRAGGELVLANPIIDMVGVIGLNSNDFTASLYSGSVNMLIHSISGTTATGTITQIQSIALPAQPVRLKAYGSFIYVAHALTYSAYYMNPVTGATTLLYTAASSATTTVSGLAVDDQFVYLASGNNIHIFNK